MIKKVLSIIIILFLPLISTYAKTLTVGANAPYSKIQDAVNAASNNDTIVIQKGIYHERITSRISGLRFVGDSKTDVIWTSFERALKPHTWTKSNNYVNIYQTNTLNLLNRTVQGIIDDLYTGVYKQKTSLNDVDSIPGTFLISNGRLYCHTSDGISPALHTMWYSAEAYGRIVNLTGGGNYSFENISFIGATEFGISITSPANLLGRIRVRECLFRSIASSTANGGNAIMVKSSSGRGGELSISDSDFLYCISPTYDPRHSVFTDAKKILHPYQGSGVFSASLREVSLEGCRFQYLREATNDTGSLYYNIRRCFVSDVTVHPHFHNMSSDHRFRIENSIYSKYGSTTGARSNGSSAGFKIYLINNTIYAGENRVIGSGDKMWFSATDSSRTVIPSEVTIYNNLFIRDKDAESNNSIPLELYNVPLNRVQMDYNGYAYGRVKGGETGIFIRFANRNFTLDQWKTYTVQEKNPKDAHSFYEPVPENIRLMVPDYQHTQTMGFGQIREHSPVINKGLETYAPKVDYNGASRRSADAPDIGAFEFNALINPITAPKNISIIEIKKTH